MTTRLFPLIVRQLGLGAFASCILTSWIQAESATEKNSVTALRELKIEAGSLQFLEREEHPKSTTNDRAISNVPPRTVLKILLNPANGSNINIQICLPDADKWNGRLIGLGNGGAAGNINPNGLYSLCAQGFAAVTTDMGTAPNANSGIGNPEVWKDFGFRATHLMTVVAKQVLMTVYGKTAEYSYFIGGSTGGQQALQEAQRYPEDYDGIIANVPAHCRTPLHAYFLWNDQILKKHPFTPSQQSNIEQAGVEYMASRQVPALAGKCVADPRSSSADIKEVISLARKKDPSLTDAQAAALEKLFDGPRHTVTGERIFCGIPFGSSIENAHGHLYLFGWAFNGKKPTEEINFGADIETYSTVLGPYLNAENPDLGPFERRGGKLIMVSGLADSIVPFHATLDYYEQVIEHFGGLEKVHQFSRLYLIPGMGHGGQTNGLSGPSNTTKMLMDWREKGVAPNEVICRRTIGGKVEVEMPVYPYPQQTVWNSETGSYQPGEGARRGVDRVADRFRPAPAQ